MYSELMKANTEQQTKSPEIISYFDNFRGISFLNDLFKKHPDLFETPNSLNKHSDCCGEFVFYLLYSGQVVKASCLFDEFELFVKNSNPETIKIMMTNPSKIFGTGINLITWARYLKETQNFECFEPILQLNNIVLQTFFETRKITWNDKSFNLEELRPIAFTNVGENITDLLPYIAYLFNFLINCQPYEFNSVANGNVQNIYVQAMNQYFENSWRRLIKNYPMLKIETFYASLDNDSIFGIVEKEDIRSLLKEILSIDNVLKIRNGIIENNPEILSACIRDQLAISQHDVLIGFNEVLSRLVDIVVQSNPLNRLIQKIPFFSAFEPNLEITYRIVEWCLCGSETPFLISDSFEFIPLQNYLKKLNRIPSMKIKTGIQKNLLCREIPFLLSNPAQQIISGYVIREMNDVLNDVTLETDNLKPLSTDANDLIESEIFNVFINGSFAKHNKTLLSVFSQLHQNDILLLESISNSLNKFYQNQFSNNIVRSYLFSFFPEYLLKFCQRQSEHSIKSFSNFVYWCLENSEIDQKKIENLLNLEYALMCVNNRDFVNLVNQMSARITSLILHNSFIFQPYIKKTTNRIHEWTIGGISLCRKSVISNPLIRGCEFIRKVRGTTEEIEIFMDWIQKLDNQTINETVEEFIKRNEVNSIKNIIISRFNNVSAEKRLKCLENYIFDGTKFKIRNDVYFVSDQILQDVIQFSFDRQFAKNIQSPDLYWRELKISTDKISTTFPSKNKFFIGKVECSSYIMENGEYVEIPVIQFNSEIETLSIIYQPPQGLKVLKIITPSGDLSENNVFFLFTNSKISQDWIPREIQYNEMNKLTTNGGTVKISL